MAGRDGVDLGIDTTPRCLSDRRPGPCRLGGLARRLGWLAMLAARLAAVAILAFLALALLRTWAREDRARVAAEVRAAVEAELRGR